jgi:hypothetical protein
MKKLRQGKKCFVISTLGKLDPFITELEKCLQ